MRKFINEMSVKAVCKAASVKERIKDVLSNKKGEGYVDTGIKIIIAVVIGGLILAGLYVLFNTTIIPNMKTKVGGMFDYKG